ncbi:MAG: Glyoxalase/Bleomycin resistance protein/Dioxygenase superfamily [Chloroflexota bacterium]|jgi:predicted enzyme related to lactoylglutathione lyase|nr:Glyoxalase/Bleomycin resistance protein/Dioxygenase superfamily [Chloroflexota bacterium]
MFEVKGIRSWNVNAERLDETVRFYRDIVGGEEGRTATIGGVTVAHIKLGNLTLGLFDASEGPRPGVPHHTFDIAWPGESDEVIKKLEAQGVKVDGTRLHRDGPGYSIYFDDPSGNRVELSTDPE